MMMAASSLGFCCWTVLDAARYYLILVDTGGLRQILPVSEMREILSFHRWVELATGYNGGH